ncbi:MAG: CcmD family protein [Bacteroidetes bacterium]|nr:MAG: CcmD family protein [Bacteroidota bacterium]
MHFIAEAQESVNKIGMADAMRESGKIYVVVGVLLIIFLGFIAFLIMTDRKISKLEKEIKAK